MPKIEIELDTETFRRADSIASRFGMTVERWLASRAGNLTYFRTTANAWDTFATPIGLVRLILFTHWDPLGVFGNPNAMYEYDAYARDVCKRLESGASDEELIALLNYIEKSFISLPGDRPELREVAAKLRRVFDMARSA